MGDRAKRSLSSDRCVDDASVGGAARATLLHWFAFEYDACCKDDVTKAGLVTLLGLCSMELATGDGKGHATMSCKSGAGDTERGDQYWGLSLGLICSRLLP